MLKACIFDLDGTLVNTLPTVHYYNVRSLAHFGFGGVTMDQCRELCRLSIAQFYHKLLRLGGCPEERVEELSGPIRDYDIACYMQDYRHLTEPFPGIPELLRALRERGVVTAVLTNKPRDLAEHLMADLFPGLFDEVRGQTPHTISKPDPRSLWNLLADLGVAKEDCLYVGDTDVDMETARAAGVAAAAVAWGYQSLESLLTLHPDFTAHTPQDLLPLFA